jgi:hypothetical protein
VAKNQSLSTAPKKSSRKSSVLHAPIRMFPPCGPSCGVSISASIHNIRNPSPCLNQVGPSPNSGRSSAPSPSTRAPFQSVGSSLLSFVERITECCVKSWSGRPTSWCASFVGVAHDTRKIEWKVSDGSHSQNSLRPAS